MRGFVTLALLSSIPPAVLIAVAALVIAAVVGGVAFFLFRGGKKKPGASPNTNAPDWQRQQAGAVGQPGAWGQQNQQPWSGQQPGSQAGWGDPNAAQQQWGGQGAPQQQQPAGWGMPSSPQQQGGWDAPAQQQPSAPAWGAPAAQQPPSAAGWGAPAQQQQGGWDAPAQQQPSAPAWGAPAAQQQSGWAGQGVGMPGGQQPWEQQQAVTPPPQDPWAQQQQQQQAMPAWGGQNNQQQAPNAFGGADAAGQGWSGGVGQMGQAGPGMDPWGQQPPPQQQGSWPNMAGVNQQQPMSPPPGSNAAQQGWQPGGFPQGQMAQPVPQGQPGYGGGFDTPDGDRTILGPVGARGPVAQGPQARTGFVRIEEGKEPGRIYEMRKESLSIGRSRESDIFLEDLAVSRLHASIISMGSGNYALRDEGSANGTKVNGQTVNKYQPYPLQEGDKIQLGQTVLVFAHR